jgi:Skp family chaperone for outer membrane proteins
LALEAVTATDAAALPGFEAATDDWDEVMATIDVDAMMRQAAAAKEQEAEARRQIDEARRREDEERHARQARERQLAQEKANMELLARCLNQVVEKVRRTILYDRNTPTIRTSLVLGLPPASIRHLSL